MDWTNETATLNSSTRNRSDDLIMDMYYCMFTESFDIVTAITAVTVFAMTTFGNTLILISILKFRRTFKGSLYILIGNLAVTDLILGLVMLLLITEIIFPASVKIWEFCLVKATGIAVTYLCSILSLLMISVDRFMAVVFPMKHIVKMKRTRFFFGIVGVVWATSLSVVVVVLLLVERPETVICRVGVIFPSHLNIVAISVMCGKLLIGSTIYSIIAWKIKASSLKPRKTYHRHFTRKTYIMIIVFILFAVCWSPFIVCTLWLEFVSSKSQESTLLCIREYSSRFGFLNSAMNWIVYGVSHKKFRMAFKELLFFSSCANLICLSKDRTDKELDQHAGKDTTDASSTMETIRRTEEQNKRPCRE